jgi:hypothetical protein
MKGDTKDYLAGQLIESASMNLNQAALRTGSCWK